MTKSWNTSSPPFWPTSQPSISPPTLPSNWFRFHSSSRPYNHPFLLACIVSGLPRGGRGVVSAQRTPVVTSPRTVDPSIFLRVRENSSRHSRHPTTTHGSVSRPVRPSGCHRPPERPTECNPLVVPSGECTVLLLTSKEQVQVEQTT